MNDDETRAICMARKAAFCLKLAPLLLIPALLLEAGGCKQEIEEQLVRAEAFATDSDGDGLTDLEELTVWGTSPVHPDTDADGFDDFREIITLNFNPDTNNYRFNPLVADIPRLSVRFLSPPEIGLRFIRSDSSSTAVSNSQSNEQSTETTVSTTRTNETSIEQTHSVETTVGYEFPGGGSASVSYGYSHSTTNTQSFSFSKEQSVGNTKAYEQGIEQSMESGTETDGGFVALAVGISNPSNVAFTLESLTLSLTRVARDEGLANRLIPIGSLDFDVEAVVFPSTTLGPGDDFSPLVFTNENLSFQVAQDMLRYSSSLMLDVALYELTNEDGTPFSHTSTGILASTVTVHIDYGPDSRPSERYFVSTNAVPGSPGITAARLMEILRASYTLGTAPWDYSDDDVADGTTFTGLQSVRGVATDFETEGSWQIVHTRNNGIEFIPTTYNLINADYDFDAIDLQAGDVFHLVYVSDADNDDVWSREEILAGTDPDDADSDDDMVSDYDEMYGWGIVVDSLARVSISNPLVIDTDGDGVDDGGEFLGGTDASNPDTDGDWIRDDADPSPTTSADTDLTSFDALITMTEYPLSTVDLMWTLNNAIPGVSDQAFMILRQEVASASGIAPVFPDPSEEPVAGMSYSVGDFFPCSGTAECWEVEYFSGAPMAADTTSDFLATNRAVKYLPYIRINGRWHRSTREGMESTELDFSVLEFTLNSYEVEDCVDSVVLFGLNVVANNPCESRWLIDLSGDGGPFERLLTGPVTAIAGVPNGTILNVTSDANMGIRQEVFPANATVTVLAPQIDGYCITFRPMLQEDDTDNPKTGSQFDVTTCWSDAGGTWDMLEELHVEDWWQFAGIHFSGSTYFNGVDVNMVRIVWSLADVTP